jgi:hypothetical protein
MEKGSLSNVDRLCVLAVTVLVMTAVLSGLSVVLGGGADAGMLAVAVLSNGILAGVVVLAFVRSILASRNTRRAVRKARQQEVDAALLDPAAHHPPRQPPKMRYEMPRRRIIPFRW